MSNKITGGLFFSSVIMGRDISVTLPAEIRPALTGLPPASPVFTGREHAAEALREALRPDCPGGVQLVSAVAGMAGVGKTELVLHIAHEVLADGWFPGGVLFVDMFGYDPDRRVSAEDALAGWLSALGIPGEHMPADLSGRSLLWRSVLDAYTTHDRRLLLVIDNVDSEEQVRPLLPSDGRIPVLVTSRHTLDLDARLHDLDVLGQDASTDVLAEVIGTRLGPEDPRLQADHREALTELAGLCAGLPLALRIVAALLVDRRQLQPQTLADRLRAEQHRLSGLTRQQKAVRSAFDLSYQHLTVSQARLFRLIPINPGTDIATIAAAHLAGLPEHEAAELLADLHRAHLVTEPAPERWSMHDLLRLHAAEQQRTSDGGEEAETSQARQRLYRYYLWAASAASTHLTPTAVAESHTFASRGEALTWLDSEHANLMAVAASAPAFRMTEVTIDLALTLGEYQSLRRHFDDWIIIATRARHLCHHVGDRSREAAASNNLSIAYYQAGHFSAAAEAATHAQQLFHQLGDQRYEGAAWDNLGLALTEMQQFEEAAEAFGNSLKRLEEAGDLRATGRVWNDFGIVLRQTNRLDKAIEVSANARDILRMAGDKHGEAKAWGNLGGALAENGQPDEAAEAQANARNLFQEAGDPHGEAVTSNDLGLALIEAGRPDEAVEPAIHAREIFQQTGDHRGEGLALNNLGIALNRLGRHRDAYKAHSTALDIFDQLRDRLGLAQTWAGLGRTLSGLNRLDDAIDSHARAGLIFATLGDRYGEGQEYRQLGIVLFGAGRVGDAVKAHLQAGKIFQDIGERQEDGLTAGSLFFILAEEGLPGSRDIGEHAILALSEGGKQDLVADIRERLDELPR
ncbi:ATP-binding protein [Micromonospora sp. NPDC051543]|uniref:ATP-binding protein n=1 Tax=Micromonospora sp. NPDC051543 TaxID=3364287 RepID=UPI0037ACC848